MSKEINIAAADCLMSIFDYKRVETMKCNNITCQHYNSEYFDNCGKAGQLVKDCPDSIVKNDCSTCNKFTMYKPCAKAGKPDCGWERSQDGD